MAVKNVQCGGLKGGQVLREQYTVFQERAKNLFLLLTRQQQRTERSPGAPVPCTCADIAFCMYILGFQGQGKTREQSSLAGLEKMPGLI